MATAFPTRRMRFTLTGQVQGVGFRPYVYRLACGLGLTGWVVNDARGVRVEVQGTEAALRAFTERLPRRLPPLAQIADCRAEPVEAQPGEKRFEILPSAGGELADAQVTVDTATCADCLRELDDPADPRCGYPFINCTNCGPRYTIVRRIPYDRPNTTMAGFEMCELCARQYADPADRRFHAQPVACPRCGPRVWLARPDGEPIDCDDPIAAAAGRLRAGRVVALKGLGGFHLACRADDEAVVRALRRRKRRDAKPFALMVRDLAAARALCELTDEAADLLTGPLRPIVLLPRRPGPAGQVAPSVAAGLDTLGLMLPYTPLHHLLLRRVDAPLVMTSANLSEEPLVKDNDEAIERLGPLADALLLHDRPIERRLDDSVVQLAGPGRLSVLRRARGYAPRPVRLEFLAAAEGGGNEGGILAVGAELKSAVCLYRAGRAVLGEHIGDLKDGRTYRHFIETVAHLEALFELTPDTIACDLHPQYLSSEYAVRRLRGLGPGARVERLVRVQHHHAHAAACLAENGRTGPAVALVCDGVGYGDDGAVWGGEVLSADVRGFRRLGHLRYIRLPGGDRAAVQTHRPAVGALYDCLGADCLRHPAAARLGAGPEELDAAVELLALDANAPASSSLGRWFDAVAALCGLAGANRFEGEAPMLLEAAAGRDVEETYPFALEPGEPFEIDLRPMTVALADDLAGGADVPTVAAKFHNTVAAFLLAAACEARRRTGLSLAVLSGGCFANRYLTARLAAGLEAEGFEVLLHRTVPTNDGGIALGQAVVAAGGGGGQSQPRSR